MTRLQKKVRRVVAMPRQRRELVVTLELREGEAFVAVRELGRRSGFEVTVGSLYTLLAMREAENKRIARQGRRRRLA